MSDKLFYRFKRNQLLFLYKITYDEVPCNPMETTMNASTRRTLAALPFLMLMSLGAQAHDFTADIAQFNKVAATKKMDSKEAVSARVALERSQGVMEQADVKMLLRIR